jgi:hypothetical protein
LEKERIEKLLREYKNEEISLEETLALLKDLPFEDLTYAKVDHHRALRKGYPEVVFCPGKTVEQIKGIYQALEKRNNNIMLTRASDAIYQELKKVNAKLRYHPAAKLIYLQQTIREPRGSLLVICGGTADIPVAEEAAITAELMGSRVTRIYDVGVAGIHRLLHYREQLFTANAIVAVAGMEGALASVIAGLAPCPVIAVPTSVGYGANFKGVSALLTMLNSCAPNVAVVNIDNGFGGGLMGSLINLQKE